MVNGSTRRFVPTTAAQVGVTKGPTNADMALAPMEHHMRYAYTLTTTLPASADEIYDAWVDSRAHSEMTGAEANQSHEVGAAVAAWGDYISGRNLELVPGERIVQSWRTADFTDEHEDSIITVTLEGVADGTLLTLVHSNVPEDQTSYERGGWEDHYFEPMKEYFAKRTGGKAKAAPKAKVKAKTKAKAIPKVKAAKKKARATTKAKPKAKAKGAKKAKGKTAKRKGRK
jgi:uncharacterized protein YndB with AHSA1/START domain